jgi:uncharacterized protein (DUF58 family)
MLSEVFLRSLRNLRLHTPRRRTGSTVGERRSVRRGRSVEFADYRNYTPGDDPRRVDWNIYARLEKPFIKLFEDEEDLTTHILLDSSASMHWRDEAEPTASKWQRAAELAIALGYVALTSGDKLVIETAANTAIARRYGPKRGGMAIADLIKFVENTPAPEPATTTGARPGLNAWMRRYALNAKPGICIIISDLFDEESIADGIMALGSNRLDVSLLHTLCAEELDPQFVGDLRLKDVETAVVQDLSMDDAVLGQYRQRLKEWTDDIANLCRKRGARYHLANTSLSIEQIVLQDLRREGWLI